jgi:ribonuclease E
MVTRIAVPSTGRCSLAAVVRASFRVGLRLGLLVGVAFALYRTVQSRRAAKVPEVEPWQPIVDTPRPRRPDPAPARSGAPSRAPAASSPAPDLRMPEVPQSPAPHRPLDEVGEPIEEPAPAFDEADEVPVVAAAPTRAPDRADEDNDDAAPATEPEPAMEAERFLDAAPPATLVAGELHPLDVVPEPAATAAPLKKAAKRVAKAAKKAAKNAAKKAAVAKATEPTATHSVIPTASDTTASDTTASDTTASDTTASDTAASETAERTSPAASTPSASTPAAAWVDPSAGACPQTHPVKAKLASRLFHLPGMLAYDRTKPDRCYADADAAEADGFVRSKR